MKLTFNGDSLSEIHQQIIAAADELTREDVSVKEPIKYPTLADVAKQKVPKELVEAVFGDVPDLGIKYADHAEKIDNAFPGIDWAKRTNQPVENLPFAQPQSDGHVPAGTQSTKIDGYNVSDGKVWVPVEGRPSAYTGVELDKYLAQKADKESGGELDAAGTPYNPAIHTSTRTKTTKGLWKNRPGGGAVKAAEVTEPREVVHKLTPSGEVKLEWQPATTEASQPATVQQVVAHEDSAPAIGRAPSMHNYESFKTNLMTIVVKLINENKITRDYMKDLIEWANTQIKDDKQKISNLWDIKNHDALCQQLFVLFKEQHFIMGA